MLERLNAWIAHSGIASRRRADQLIQSGHVFVNDVRVTKLGSKIEPTIDRVRIDEQPITAPGLVYYAFSKPAGVISARSSARKESLVTDFVPTEPPVVPVGRLDRDSTGLMILTNDGAFAHQLTHPKFLHEKEYVVAVRAPAASAMPLALERLARGVRVLGERLNFDRCDIQSVNGDQAVLRVVIHTGKKRQIRRMAAAVGLAVDSLTRTRIGLLKIGALKSGEWREIRPTEVLSGYKASALPKS